MIYRKFRIAEESASLQYAKEHLERAGWCYDKNARYLLLPVPTKNDYKDRLRCDTVVIGGNLKTGTYGDRKCVDLLQDPLYLAENAKITAYCAVKYALERLPVILDRCPVLIIGWGRIGKCLGQLFKRMGADVTIYARKPADRAALMSLGYQALDSLEDLERYRLIINTAPAMLLSPGVLCDRQIKIDLASTPGIPGEDVIWARGLPGKDAPESAGRLIACTVERLRREGLL